VSEESYPLLASHGYSLVSSVIFLVSCVIADMATLALATSANRRALGEMAAETIVNFSTASGARGGNLAMKESPL
jgi:hypothetical protein